jgi:hypothetical protein
VVGCEEHTHSAAADEDSSYLGPFVAHAEEGEGDDYDADYGPEVEELGGEDILVLWVSRKRERSGEERAVYR